MLVAGQRVADQDGVGAIRIQRAIGFIADLDRRQQRTAIQPEGTGQDDMARQTETLVVAMG